MSESHYNIYKDYVNTVFLSGVDQFYSMLESMTQFFKKHFCCLLLVCILSVNK